MTIHPAPATWRAANLPSNAFSHLTAWAAALWRRAGLLTVERLASAFFAITVLGMLGYAALRPAYNWDLIPYAATALENRYDNPVDLHAETWRQIEADITTPAHLYTLQSGNPYNRDQYENPDHFASQLSMYRVKVGYIAVIRALEPVFGLVRSINLISLAGFTAFAGLSYFWLSRAGARTSLVFAVPLFLLAGAYEMATVATPDMAVGAISVGALMAIRNGKAWTGMSILAASVLFRPDNLILIFALLLTALAFGWKARAYLTAFAAAFAAVVLIADAGGHPGWWAHFWFSNVQIQNDMAGFHPDFSLAAMAKGYMRGLIVGVLNNDWPPLLIGFVGAWALLGRAGKITGKIDHGLLFALMIGIGGKFASFPLPDDRFYFPFIAGIILILLSNWRPRLDAQAD